MEPFGARRKNASAAWSGRPHRSASLGESLSSNLRCPHLRRLIEHVGETRSDTMRLSRAFVPAILALTLCAATISAPSVAAVSIGISVGFAPPPLPIYDQPVIPGPGYIWMPGYWAYGPNGYYWVPGTWVLPPGIGLLWTPPWWGWNGTIYVFHAGYWGPRVGYYGGINYGFGYFGSGFVGGRWDRGRFFYNREVNNFGNRR